MAGKNVYLSVFPEFLELLSFCLLKLAKTIDLQVMRVTIMLRITRLSLSTGWCKNVKKIRITLSTVASSLTKIFSVFSCFSDEPVTEDDSMFATGENESLFKVRKRRIRLENLN